jgi:ABC-type uncharacterized transport system auxiliary subunit
MRESLAPFWAPLSAALLACASGCFGSVAEVKHRHFLLQGTPPAATPARAGQQGPVPVLGTLWVKDFQVDAIYDRAQLVHRRSTNEVWFSRDEVWAARAGRMLADAVARQWLTHSPFGAISRSAGEAPAAYSLAGEITALEAVEAPPGGSATAHLAWVLQLSDNRSGKVLGQYVFDATGPLEHGDSPGAQMATALDALLGQATLQAASAVCRDLLPQPSAARAGP